MAAMTRELIDAALDLGGRYYLPYRLHATREQFQRAYPQADAFFALKRKYDPNEIFQNQFYLKYGLAVRPDQVTSVACFHAVAGKHVLAEACLRPGGEDMAPIISAVTKY